MTKKQSKRILSVTIRRMPDDDPDTSYYGEYSSKRTSEFSIDRAHSEDCAINTGAPVCYFSDSGHIELKLTLEQAESVSHSGQCDDDVKYLSEVPDVKKQLEALDAGALAKDLSEYGAWDAEELTDHTQNLQRILWLAGGDITENSGCDCGGGHLDSRECRFFNPSFNYVDKNGKPTDGLTAEEVQKYTRQDYDRRESLSRGDWQYIGIRADAHVSLADSGPVQQITSGGVWGYESDMSPADFSEVESEQLAELKTQLLALGFSRRPIAAAFKSIERKDS